jgi:hypothetical protein
LMDLVMGFAVLLGSGEAAASARRQKA